MQAILFSLADFIRAGLRPRTPLARAIVLVLAVKLVAIILIKLVWFSGDAPAGAAALSHLLGPSSTP